MASGALSTFQMTQDVIANRPAAAAYLGFWYAKDQGQTYYSDGVKWIALGANDIPLSLRSGMYYDTRPATGVSTSGAITNNQLRAWPMPIARDVTLTRLSGEVTVIGDVGSVLRMGIYADDGQGRPAALILDAGTIPTDAVAIAEVVINLPLTAGMYWAAAVVQGAPVTLPTLRVDTGGAVALGTAVVPTGANQGNVVSMAGVAGALPTPFVTAEATILNTAPRIYTKVA